MELITKLSGLAKAIKPTSVVIVSGNLKLSLYNEFVFVLESCLFRSTKLSAGVFILNPESISNVHLIHH
jgi:hypothetical protein